MRFLFIEPFYGGSHRCFADGLIAHSRHEIDLLHLPSRFWKWRMRGAALHFANQIDPAQSRHAVICTNLMSVADFKALLGPACPPVMLYFHESQLTYPLAPGERKDYQYGFTEITSALTADQVVFNSHTHRLRFMAGIDNLLRHMPEYRPRWVTARIADKSSVLYPGCRLKPPPRQFASGKQPPLIVWNHRWEFDKNPTAFFKTLDAIAGRGIAFRLAVLGENFQVVPKPFLTARQRLKKQIIHFGFIESHSDYMAMLSQADVIVSTALQENFGIAVVEAIACGCLPLLPNRLVYPEILPSYCHRQLLYSTDRELENKLAEILTDMDRYRSMRRQLASDMMRFDWRQCIDAYDRCLEKLAVCHYNLDPSG